MGKRRTKLEKATQELLTAMRSSKLPKDERVQVMCNAMLTWDERMPCVETAQAMSRAVKELERFVWQDITF